MRQNRPLSVCGASGTAAERSRPTGWMCAQGESPDLVLQRIIEAKSEMRKNMLSGYMKALDESEGLQQTISRLADRMGVGERQLTAIPTLA